MRYFLRGLGKVGILFLLTASGPCGRGPAPTSASTPEKTAVPTTAPADPVPQKAPIVSKDPYTSATELVDATAALPTLNKASLEGLLRVSMARAPTTPPDLQYYEAILPSGAFSKVEVRTSNSAQEKFEMVILDARDYSPLLLSAFRTAGRIRPDTQRDVDPRIPPEGEETYTEQRKQQIIRYAFRSKSEQLTAVVVERRPGE
jgi:hypothetical protein